MTIVPYDQLAPQTLWALIEEFVTREGAVHGHGEVSIESQIAGIQRQLRAGTVSIVYDHESESCTICPREDLAGIDSDGPHLAEE